MASSLWGQTLNPSSQPFFPTQRGSSEVREMTSSPVPLGTSFSSDEEFRVRTNPDADNGGPEIGGASTNEIGRFASPSPIPGNVFADYRMDTGRAREHSRDSHHSVISTSSTSSRDPVLGTILQGKGGSEITFTQDSRDPRDITNTDPVFIPRIRSDYQFTNPISSPAVPASLTYGRPVSSLQMHETEKTNSSQSDSRENSLNSSIDYTFGSEEGRLHNGHTTESSLITGPGYSTLALQNKSSMSSRSGSSANYDMVSAATRGTTPLSQSYELMGPSPTAGLVKTSLVVPQTDRILISPASSTRSSSHVRPFDTPVSIVEEPLDMTFDAQAKASPFINDLLDRLLRCEYSNKEIQRELSDVSRKINILMERALVESAANDQSAQRQQNANAFSTLQGGSHFNSGMASSRSVSGPAPSSAGMADELQVLRQQVAALTTSLSQNLVSQTQAHLQSVNAGFANGNTNTLGLGAPNNANSPLGLGIISPNMNGPMNGGVMGGPLGPLSTRGIGGGQPPNHVHVLPNRPDTGVPPRNGLRGAPIPRQWSVGSLDHGPRNPPVIDFASSNPLVRDKRKSIGNILRRDSTASLLDDNGSSRENGPVIQKWENLPLLPDLLRSIAKYGVGPPNKIQQRALPFLLRGSDIIAQAPPTQERIAAYVIPAIHVALTHLVGKPPNRGPIVVIISTTVDQATQAQRMIRDLGGPIGVRSALGVGVGGDVVQELRLLQQSMPHVLCGTPQKLHSLFTSPGGLPGNEVRFLVLDEVDQLIARNLHDFVFNIVKLFPSPRTRPPGSGTGSTTPLASPALGSSANPFNPFDAAPGGVSNGLPSPFGPGLRRFSSSLSVGANEGQSPLLGSGSGLQTPNLTGSGLQGSSSSLSPERQTALFSNTVPQDVLNLANAIQLREPVRVLVRRDGNVTHADTSNGARGLRQFYLYLAFTAGGRMEPGPSTPGGGLGIIGSGRGASNPETTQAREWKLDALADLFADIEVGQAIVHVGGLTALESVVYKLGSRGLEAVPLHGDMNPGTKLAALNKFRGSNNPIARPQTTRVLVVYDVQVKAPDVFQVPLVINYDLPKAVEEYAHRVAPAISSSYSRAGVVINFVTATGGDVEMLRSIECFYKIKCPEVPMSLRDVI